MSGNGPHHLRGHLSRRQALPAGSFHARHCHSAAYIAVVLEGTYNEAGDEGRYRAVAGSVLVHSPFDAHLNCVDSQGATVLNLPLPPSLRLPPMGLIGDPDAVARIAEKDPREAVHVTVSGLFCSVQQPQDWPDLLAERLKSTASVRLREWADDMGLAPGTISRGFRKAYGVSAARFRWEARARYAWRQIVGASAPLAEIALSSGFADQAHMTRAVKAVTGSPPSFWRRTEANFFKTKELDQG